MPALSAWDSLSPTRLYGVTPQPPPAIPAASTPIPSLARSGGPGLADIDSSKALHPDHPLFWFGALALATFGLIFASTTVRVGAVKVSASAGKS